MKTINLLLLCCLCFYAEISAQETPADLQIELNAKVNSMELSDAGIVILNTNDGLAGISHENSEPVFEFTTYGRLKEEDYYKVPNSPYMVISDGGFGGLKQKKAVINYYTGQVIFESKGMNWGQVFTESVLLPENKLVISGYHKEGSKFEKVTPKIAVYNLDTGEIDFSFFMSKPGKVTMGSFLVTGDAKIWEDKVLVPTSRGVYAKTFDGQTLWQNDVKDITNIHVGKNAIYGFELRPNGNKTKIYKMDANGNESWDKPVKVKGKISNFQITDKGLAVVSDKEGGSSTISFKKAESEIAFLDAQTGEDLWDKAPKTKGYVQHFYEIDDGFLFGVFDGGINKITYDGEGLYRKPLKTGENILTMAMSPQGLIYITTEDANIIDLDTGETVWKKRLKFKSSDNVVSTYDEKNGRYLIATKKVMFAIDENTGEYEELIDYKFEEKESPTDLEMRGSNIYLSSSQNMYLFDKNGNEIYHEYYKSPGKSTFGKIALGVLAVASTAMAAQQSYVAGANKNTIGQYNNYGARAKNSADMFEGIGTVAFNEMAKRFRASVATKDSHILLTKTKNGVGLLKLSKDTGDVDKELTTGDKKPEYVIDEVDQVLYYLSDKKTISVFKI